MTEATAAATGTFQPPDVAAIGQYRQLNDEGEIIHTLESLYARISEHGFRRV